MKLIKQISEYNLKFELKEDTQLRKQHVCEKRNL